MTVDVSDIHSGSQWNNCLVNNFVEKYSYIMITVIAGNIASNSDDNDDAMSTFTYTQ